MIKILLLASTLALSGCMVNPISILDSIKVILDSQGKVLTVVQNPLDK